MPKIPNYYAPSIKSVSGAPKDSAYLDQFIAARDDQLRRLTSELQGSSDTASLTFELITVPMLDSKSVLIRSRKASGPIAGALLLSSSPDDPDEIVFSPSSTPGECSIEALFDTAPANPVSVKLLLVFGT